MIDRWDLDILNLAKRKRDYISPQTVSKILRRPFGGIYLRLEKLCADGYLIRNGGVMEYRLTDMGLDQLK